MVYRFGLKAENHFISKMNELGLSCEFVDKWYDFEVNKVKVEVKSTTFSIRDGNKGSREISRFGRFNFGCEDTRNKLFKENVWVCYVLRSFSHYMILGFARAKETKKKKHISLTQLKSMNIISLEDWLEVINK